MKIVILLFTSTVFLNFTGAAVRGGPGIRMLGRPERNPPADPTALRIGIRRNSPIFLQMPGDHVLVSILRDEKRGLPNWLRQTSSEVATPERIFLNEPGEPRVYGRKAIIGITLHNNNDPLVQGYTCFIKTFTGVLAARLEPDPRPSRTLEAYKMPYIFLRTEPLNLIYGGPLRTLAADQVPEWVNRYSLNEDFDEGLRNLGI